MSDPLRSVIGGRSATALEKAFGMRDVGDLLRHYPRRYARRGELTDLASLAEGEQATVLAAVVQVTGRPMRERKGHLLEVVVGDGTGTLTLTFFNQTWRQQELRVGRVGLFAGKVGSYRGSRQLAHPSYALFTDADPETPAAGVAALPPGEEAAELMRDFNAVYPATAKVTSWTIGRCVRLVLEHLAVGPSDDPVPDDVARGNGLPGLADALRWIHLPADQGQIDAARRKLTFDEAWVVQVVLAQRRHQVSGMAAAARPATPGGLVDLMHGRLPYRLTAGQRAVIADIDADLSRPHPMHRLLQGEVGSGKTVVALHAMLRVVESGGQAALLAPTEVLAEQHLRSIRALLGPMAEAGMLGGADRATRVDLLTGSMSAAARRSALTGAAGGATGILIGTHALLSDPVQFAELGLVVVDEQHRFGVQQRAALAQRGPSQSRPHVLVMTATPIPRTIAMTVFGDLAVSTLREMPAGRAPIVTHLVPPEKPAYQQRMWQRIREEVAAGRQAYVVCPRIDAADDAADEQGASGGGAGAAGPARPASVVELAGALAAGPLAAVRVGVLHGRLPAEEKDRAMQRFADPTRPDGIDVLVSTTVIEVGVDVPNATVMAVMDAERFGVSQLHQLRGRVGRGAHQGLCLLQTSAPDGSAARERLSAVAATADGFRLAEVDLAQRREGDVLGAAQSGRRSRLRLLSVLSDGDVIEAARSAAEPLVAADPLLERHDGLRAAVDRWAEEDMLEFVDKA